MKKFWEYIKKNNIWSAIIIVIFCTMIFILRENVEIKKQTIVFVNLMAFGILVFLLYNSTRKKYLKKNYLIFMASGIFFFNRFYDETVFLEVFHFEMRYFINGACLVSALIILYPFLKKVLFWFGSKASNLLEGWTEERIEEDKGAEEKSRENIQKRKEKLEMRSAKERKVATTSGNAPSEMENEKIETKEFNLEESGIQSLKKELPTHAKMTWIVSLLLVIVTAVLMLLAFLSQDSKAIKDITIEKLPAIALSVAVTIMLIIFIAGIIVSLFAKWVQIIKDIMEKRHKGELYFLYACGLIIVSQYIFTNYSYTTDDLADLLLSGKLFTFPLILSIIIPVFLIFAENIVSYTRNNSVIKDILEECATQSMEIAKGIVEASLTFIKFITSDFLTTIIELADEDVSNEKEILDEEKESKDCTYLDKDGG